MPIIKKIEEISGKKYDEEQKIFRILADHIRGVVFLVSEGIIPSNLGQGYIVRRLLRRMIRLGRKNKLGESIDLPNDFLIILAREVIENYKEFYPAIKLSLGRLTVKVLPWPSLLLTESSPPCLSIICFTIERPSPVPSFPLALALVARKNSSKMFSSSSAGMPMPVSTKSI